MYTCACVWLYNTGIAQMPAPIRVADLPQLQGPPQQQQYQPQPTQQQMPLSNIQPMYQFRDGKYQRLYGTSVDQLQRGFHGPRSNELPPSALSTRANSGQPQLAPRPPPDPRDAILASSYWNSPSLSPPGYQEDQQQQLPSMPPRASRQQSLPPTRSRLSKFEAVDFQKAQSRDRATEHWLPTLSALPRRGSTTRINIYIKSTISEDCESQSGTLTKARLCALATKGVMAATSSAKKPSMNVVLERR